MCGIVGAIAAREVSQILLEGLKRLEYRGYDSAGIALVNEPQAKVETLKSAGKVEVLVQSAKKIASRACWNCSYALGTRQTNKDQCSPLLP